MAYTKQNFKDGQVLKAEHLNHIEEGISSLEQGVADWNAKEGESGHVLNRTHWVEGGKVHKLPGKFLPDGVPYVEKGGMVEIPVSGEWADSSQYIITAPMGLEAGNTYTVVWDGVEYTTTARNENIEGMSAVVIGNLFGESTEPFGIAELSAEAAAQMGMCGMACPYGATPGFVDFSIKGESVKVNKIDPRCLPDGVGGGGAYAFVVDAFLGENGMNATTKQTFAEVYQKVVDPNTSVRGMLQMYMSADDTEPAMITFVTCDMATTEKITFSTITIGGSPDAADIIINKLNFYSDETIEMTSWQNISA